MIDIIRDALHLACGIHPVLTIKRPAGSVFASSEVLAAELSVGVAAIATSLVGASLLYSRGEQLNQLADSLDKDDTIKRLRRFRRLLIGLLFVGTILCLVSIIAMIEPVLWLGITSFSMTIVVLGTGLDVGRRLTQ